MSTGSTLAVLASRGLIVNQVVMGSATAEQTNSTTTYADTGLTASITPRDPRSMILVLVAQSGVERSSGNTQNGCWLKLVRDSTDLVVFGYAVGYTGSSVRRFRTAHCTYVDSPGTTSFVTYKTQFKNNAAASRAAVQVDGAGADSRIVLVEISVG